MNSALRALIVVAIASLFTAVLTWAHGTQHHTNLLESPMLLCALIAFLIQWLVFIPSYLYQTERFYDLTGSITFVCVTFLALYSQRDLSITSILLAAMVIIWSARLGTFLFSRILKDGSDNRFDEIKPNKYRFFSAWTLQGLWVFLTASPAFMVITSTQQSHLNYLTIIGVLIWLFGFAFEVIADEQKRRFKRDPQNNGDFIRDGLWARSRHPNYFGEITLWVGVAIAALPMLSGWQHLVLMSPVFVYLLLTKVSGVPMLEQKADSKWSDNPDYLAYKQTTPVLIPKLFG